MKILVDENMPFALELFGLTGEVESVPGRSLSRDRLDGIDALMIRSVTSVDATLLSGKSVKFVGTATAGTDHVDVEFLAQSGISFASSPGCNAAAVVEYVFSSLLYLAERDGFLLTDLTVGIVGVGHVGGLLQKRMQALGVRTLLCDPPRRDKGEEGEFHPLEKLVAEADVLTFHTPLYFSGPYKTFHLVDESLLLALKPDAILLNTCRGAVFDNLALLRILEQRQDLRVVLDVWQQEPDLSIPLLEKVALGTPHIAGYSLEAKVRGTTQIFEAWTAFLGQKQSVTPAALLPKSTFSQITLNGKLDQKTFASLAHLLYDVRFDDARLRQSAGIKGEFDRLRRDYQVRTEWASLRVHASDPETSRLLQKLGFSCEGH